MSDFSQLLKEAFVDAEPFDPNPGREALRRAVTGFERRLRTVRAMAIFAVGFMSLVAVASGIALWRLPADASPRTATGWLALLGLGLGAVGFTKLWYALMMNHLQAMKELKRAQLTLHELLGGAPAASERPAG